MIPTNASISRSHSTSSTSSGSSTSSASNSNQPHQQTTSANEAQQNYSFFSAPTEKNTEKKDIKTGSRKDILNRVDHVLNDLFKDGRLKKKDFDDIKNAVKYALKQGVAEGHVSDILNNRDNFSKLDGIEEKIFSANFDQNMEKRIVGIRTIRGEIIARLSVSDGFNRNDWSETGAKNIIEVLSDDNKAGELLDLLLKYGKTTGVLQTCIMSE